MKDIFSRLPIGKLDKNQNLSKWVDSLKETFLLYDENTYLTEYEIKMKSHIIKLQAKYDLIVIKPWRKNLKFMTGRRKIENFHFKKWKTEYRLLYIYM